MKGKKLIFLTFGVFLILAGCSTVRDIPHFGMVQIRVTVFHK